LLSSFVVTCVNYKTVPGNINIKRFYDAAIRQAPQSFSDNVMQKCSCHAEIYKLYYWDRPQIIITEALHGFLSLLRQMSGYYLKLGNDRFLTSTFQLTIRHPSCFCTLNQVILIIIA